MSKKINIDIWRFIVSFLIVAIHISPTGAFPFGRLGASRQGGRRNQPSLENRANSSGTPSLKYPAPPE